MEGRRQCEREEKGAAGDGWGRVRVCGGVRAATNRGPEKEKGWVVVEAQGGAPMRAHTQIRRLLAGGAVLVD